MESSSQDVSSAVPGGAPARTPRPLSVTAFSWLFVAAGAVGLAYHARELGTGRDVEVVWVLFVRILAIVAGVFMLLGANWARWLALAWVTYHVVLSGFHSIYDTGVHAFLTVWMAYVLFRRDATAFFRSASGRVARTPAAPGEENIE